MAYSKDLEDRIDDIVHQWGDMEKKKMFGGICYLIHGNMSFGVWMDHLIVRTGPDQAKQMLNREHVSEFDITGRPMKGWVMVGKGSWGERSELADWLETGRSFALSLPRKSPKRKTLEEIYYRHQR
jgi:TfoX/Sxy family transcriptional regulator of competence genes